MKTNYKLKTIKTGLAVFAMALSFTFASAQVATDYEENLRTVTATTYAAGAITMITGELTHEGTTFKIQCTVTPSSTAGTSFIESNGNNRWGVDDSSFDGQNGESAVINSLSIIDFNDNGTGYTQSAISNIHFSSIQIFSANNRTEDNPTITVDGANAGTFEIGQTTANSEIITFGTPYTNTAGTTMTVGSAGDVQSITLGAGAPVSFRNQWFIIGTFFKYTFTTDPGLSVNDVVKKDALAIYPTVVENTFSVNKAFETLQLIDLTGKTVKTFSVSDALEVSGLRSGLYIVKIKSEIGGVATGRLIVK